MLILPGRDITSAAYEIQRVYAASFLRASGTSTGPRLDAPAAINDTVSGKGHSQLDVPRHPKASLAVEQAQAMGGNFFVGS